MAWAVSNPRRAGRRRERPAAAEPVAAALRIPCPPTPMVETPAPKLCLLEGGSLRLNPVQKRRRRASLFWSVAGQIVLSLLMIAGLRSAPPLPRAPEPIELTYLAPPPMHYQPPAPMERRRVAPSRPHRPVAKPKPAPVTRPETAEIKPRLAPPRAVAQPKPRPDPPAPARMAVARPPAVKVELGQFGDPAGIEPRPAAPMPIPELGKFGASATATSDPSGGAGKVMSAGFGSVAANGNGPGPAAAGEGRNSVRASGFGAATPGEGTGMGTAGKIEMGGFAATAPVKIAASRAAALPTRIVEPPQVLSWPKPVYTPAAEAHKIEGEVVLQVKLEANGGVQVLHVLHGLGYGLNETAMAAARQVRFLPARRDGRPVDWTVVLHIYFQLAY